MPRLISSIALILVMATGLRADEPNAVRDPVAQSLPLRTALHQDPSLTAPLDQMLGMFRQQNRLDDLLAIYRNHLAQFADDKHAETVFVRLLVAVADPAAPARAKAAVERFPQDAYLRFLHYSALKLRHDSQALDELDRAIGLETVSERKAAWIDLLVPQAIVAGKKDLAEKHLQALAALAVSPEGQLEAARKMNQYKFYELALKTLNTARAKPLAPETMVALELEAAAAELGLTKREAAGERLDALLAKLTADHWRRAEIVARRLSLLDTPEARDAMANAAHERVKRRPGDIAAVLDLVQILSGLQQRQDALSVLLAAGEQYPKSEQIERQTLEIRSLAQRTGPGKVPGRSHSGSAASPGSAAAARENVVPPPP